MKINISICVEDGKPVMPPSLWWIPSHKFKEKKKRDSMLKDIWVPWVEDFWSPTNLATNKEEHGVEQLWKSDGLS